MYSSHFSNQTILLAVLLVAGCMPDITNTLGSDADQDGLTLWDDDCDDQDATMPGQDADCDGVLTSDDCDDHDVLAPRVSEDGDCDGFATAEDCDDADPSSTVVADDRDCDGVEAADDCDDRDNASTIEAEDRDCDGSLTADDCDDRDATVGDEDRDADCDEVLTSRDCDDSNPAMPVGDVDCDGTPTAMDCSDTDPLSHTRATDADCDGALTADDCSDSDPDAGAIAGDADCDGVTTSADCDDGDAGMPVGDRDCDGTPTALDCDDENPVSFTTAQDGDCDGLPTALDCNDSQPGGVGGDIRFDADCDGILTSMDCDDTDPSNTTSFVDAEPDSPANPTSVAPNVTESGNLCGSDTSDTWRVTPSPAAGCALMTTASGAPTLKIRSGTEIVTEGSNNYQIRTISTSLPTDIEIQGLGEVDYTVRVTKECATVTPACPTDDPFDADVALNHVYAPYGSTFAAALCTASDDVYRYSRRLGCTGTFTLAFTHSLGDLDLYVTDLNDNVLGLSESATNTEVVTAALSDTVKLWVSGYQGAQGSYTLTGNYSCP